MMYTDKSEWPNAKAPYISLVTCDCCECGHKSQKRAIAMSNPHPTNPQVFAPFTAWFMPGTGGHFPIHGLSTSEVKNWCVHMVWLLGRTGNCLRELAISMSGFGGF